MRESQIQGQFFTKLLVFFFCFVLFYNLIQFAKFNKANLRSASPLCYIVPFFGHTFQEKVKRLPCRIDGVLMNTCRQQLIV